MFSVQCCMECVVDWVHGLVLGGVGVFSGEDICVGMLCGRRIRLCWMVAKGEMGRNGKVAQSVKQLSKRTTQN